MWRRIDDWLNAYDCDDIERVDNGAGPRSRLPRLWTSPLLPESEEDTDERD